MSNLYEECLDALGNKKEILSYKKSKELVDRLTLEFSFHSLSSCIKWDNIDMKENLTKDITTKCSYEEFYNLVAKKVQDKFDNEDVVIIWDNSDFPVIKTQLVNVLNNIHDVIAVGFNTWIFVPSNYVIEFHHDDIVTIGYINKC